MSYTLKDVFYLGHGHQFDASTYGSAGIEGNIPIDISAYVDPIAKGRTRGQGLAIYKVHCQVAGDSVGNPQISTDAGQVGMALSVKPFTTTGDNSTALTEDDMSADNDLVVWGGFYTAPATRVPGQGGGSNCDVWLEPSTEVPYVAVRDTIFSCLETTVGLSTNDDLFVNYRMECAMISLDTATLNQLLRTQTA